MATKPGSLGPRGRSIFLAVVDATCAPSGELEAAAFRSAPQRFEAWLKYVPQPQVVAILAALYGLELFALLTRGERFRRLSPQAREKLLERLERSPLQAAVGGLILAARFSFQSDTELMASHGYNYRASLQRASELREREGRL